VDPVESNLHPETGPSGSSSDALQAKIDGIVALASEAIRYVDQKKI